MCVTVKRLAVPCHWGSRAQLIPRMAFKVLKVFKVLLESLFSEKKRKKSLPKKLREIVLRRE